MKYGCLQCRQSGFALLIFLLMLIGAGGVALANFAQGTLKEVNESKYNHNKRVLQEAKQALLMYVYLYPQTGNQLEGPGRLPCPDTDNDGEADLVGLCNTQPGRFPWKESRMNFYDARDSAGERLWYAVSDNFYNLGGGPNKVNSESTGSITVYDQSGSLLYDGSVNGVAAVIFAPGEEINNQDRSVANANDPSHYLDSFDPDPIDNDPNNVFDNSVFVNGVSASVIEGFRLGPVYDRESNQIVINDQMVLITSEEVIRMAEKGVLEIYKQAIDDYMSRPGITQFPWLYDYETDDLTQFITTNRVIPAPNQAVIGRVPSIFTSYFTDSNSQPIESELRLVYRKQFRIFGGVDSGSGDQTVTMDVTTSTLQNVRFDEGAADNDDLVELHADRPVGAPDLVAYKYYYRGGSPFGWRPCGADASELIHCSRENSPDFPLIPGMPNEVDSNVLRVGIRVEIDSNFRFDLDLSGFSNPGDISYEDADAGADAYIKGLFQPDDVGGDMPPAEFFFDAGTYDTSGAFLISESDSQDYDVNDNFESGGTPFIRNQEVLAYSIGLRFYPEIPAWALENDGIENRNNWHNAIAMALAPGYEPGGAGACTPGTDCLTVDGKHLTNDAISALFVIAGSNTVPADDDPPPPDPLAGLADEMGVLFSPEQLDSDTIFSDGIQRDSVLIVGRQ